MKLQCESERVNVQKILFCEICVKCTWLIISMCNQNVDLDSILDWKQLWMMNLRVSKKRLTENVADRKSHSLFTCALVERWGDHFASVRIVCLLWYCLCQMCCWGEVETLSLWPLNAWDSSFYDGGMVHTQHITKEIQELHAWKTVNWSYRRQRNLGAFLLVLSENAQHRFDWECAVCFLRWKMGPSRHGFIAYEGVDTCFDFAILNMNDSKVCDVYSILNRFANLSLNGAKWFSYFAMIQTTRSSARVLSWDCKGAPSKGWRRYRWPVRSPQRSIPSTRRQRWIDQPLLQKQPLGILSCCGSRRL